MAWIEPTEQVNGNVLDDDLWNQDVVANTLAIFRHLTPVGTVIPYAGDWGTDYVNLADPDVGAPFHLPCTGGIYETADFPLLSRVLGHTFAPLGSGHEEGDIAGGEHLVGGGNDADGNPYIAEAVYRYQTSPLGWKLVVADGFVVPDMRGRSPIGTADFWGGPSVYPETEVVRDVDLGQRLGDHRTGSHTHSVRASVTETRQVYRAGPGFGPVHAWLTGPYNGAGAEAADGEPLEAHANSGSSPQFCAYGTGHNYQPSTGVNFLIFTGQVVQSHAPKSTGLRDGSVHRLHAVTTGHMIHQRLDDPNLLDAEREMLEATLAGEPWPPITEEVS